MKFDKDVLNGVLKLTKKLLINTWKPFSYCSVKFSASCSKFTEIKSTGLQVKTSISRSFFKLISNFLTIKCLFVEGGSWANSDYWNIY